MPNPTPTTTDYTSRMLITDIIHQLRPYRGRFALSTFLRLTSDILDLYPAYAFALIITYLSQYTPGKPLLPLWLPLALWTLSFGVATILRTFSKKWCFEIAERLSLNAYRTGLRHLFALDIAWHEKENSGNKLKKIARGGDGFNRILRMWIVNVMQIIVQFIGVTTIVATIDLRISVILIVYMLVYSLVSIPYLRKARSAEREVDAEEENLHGLTFEAVNNIRSIKVLGFGLPLLERVVQQCDLVFEKIRLRIRYFQGRQATLQLVSHGFKIIMLVLVLYGIMRGHYAVGFIVLFNQYFNRFTESVAELSEVTQDFTIARVQIGRLQAMLREPITIDDDDGKVDFPENWKKITLRNVSFSYGTHEVLSGISLEIKRGERVGIVGLSGAGKSTLFKLLLKEIESFSGDILFDDISIRDIRRSSFYRYTAVVMQETEVFNFSLRDNITIANVGREHDAGLLDDSLTIAHVDDFTAKLPEGLDTLIGEKGVKLSGGEKQRVGIARAVFKQPQLLFMDEATSHLDLESEEKIQDSLHHFFKQVTAIVIAHRLTTIKEMDRIVVIENGGVIESGSFKKLHAAGGRFFQLWEKQRL